MKTNHFFKFDSTCNKGQVGSYDISDISSMDLLICQSYIDIFKTRFKTIYMWKRLFHTYAMESLSSLLGNTPPFAYKHLISVKPANDMYFPIFYLFLSSFTDFWTFATVSGENERCHFIWCLSMCTKISLHTSKSVHRRACHKIESR